MDVHSRVNSRKLIKNVFEMAKTRTVNIYCNQKHIFFAMRPHVHFLGIFTNECKPRTPNDFNSLCSAEIPNPDLHPSLHEKVKSYMLHTKCGIYLHFEQSVNFEEFITLTAKNDIVCKRKVNVTNISQNRTKTKRALLLNLYTPSKHLLFLKTLNL